MLISTKKFNAVLFTVENLVTENLNCLGKRTDLSLTKIAFAILVS